MRIQQIIKASDYAILDISHRKKRARYPNANVVMEYGVALGFSVPTMLCEHSFEVFAQNLSNAAGTDFRKYKSLPDLKKELQSILINIFLFTDPHRHREVH
ncbi:MAG: hypothetical protein ACR2M0_16620 [Chloroflexia bacterium]